MQLFSGGNIVKDSVSFGTGKWGEDHEKVFILVRYVWTFLPKRYMTRENLKVIFGTQKNVGSSLWTIPQDYFERFGILSKNEEGVSFSIFEYLILGSFWTLFRWFSRGILINIEENYMFYIWVSSENFTVNLFMCEHVDSGVKFELIWLCVSNKNQIDFE